MIVFCGLHESYTTYIIISRATATKAVKRAAPTRRHAFRRLSSATWSSYALAGTCTSWRFRSPRNRRHQHRRNGHANRARRPRQRRPRGHAEAPTARRLDAAPALRRRGNSTPRRAVAARGAALHEHREAATASMHSARRRPPPARTSPSVRSSSTVARNGSALSYASGVAGIRVTRAFYLKAPADRRALRAGHRRHRHGRRRAAAF